MNDWTGSSKQRRSLSPDECLPLFVTPARQKQQGRIRRHYVIPAGVKVSVCKKKTTSWKTYVTTHESAFTKTYLDNRAIYVFAQGEWLMRVNKGFVRMENR